MIEGDEETDLSRMLQGSVSIDEGGDFDPTNLLSQPINFNESIDELDITIDEETEHNTYNDIGTEQDENAISDGEANNESYNSEVSDSRERYFRTPYPQYHHEQNNDGNSPRRHSPRDYEPPPYKHSPKRHPGRSRSSTKYATPPRHRQRGRSTERIAEVQQRIRQVQQQIHENMDDDRSSGRGRMENRHQHPSYRREHEHEYPRHENRERMYPNNYSEEQYYDGPPPRGDRYPPRDSPHRTRPRSFNGMPSSMRVDGEAYGYPRRRSHQEPLQRPPHGGRPMMSRPHPPHRQNEYGPQERRHPMHPMPRDQSLNGSPGHDSRGFPPRGSPPPQHVLGGMAQSLHGSNNGPPTPPPHAPPMAQSYNGMNASTNGNMPPHRGIQSMSASLNGIQNMNNGAGRNPNSMLRNDMPGPRGIQSMSASLNGMSQSINEMSGGYGGPDPMNRSMNGMHPPQHRGINPMSASQNDSQNSNRGGGFPPPPGGHPLQGMSESLNGAPPNMSYRGPHPSSLRMQGDNSNNMSVMNRSNNAMGRSMNDSMNASSNGRNKSSVPSASLLNQVSNLANLPNRGANAGMIQGAGGPDTTKLSRKLMEAMKRTASSRKLIRELNIAAMLHGDMKSKSSSLSSKKSVVKAKRKASRQSYTKSQFEAAASREFVKAQKEQVIEEVIEEVIEQEQEKEDPKPQPLEVAV